MIHKRHNAIAFKIMNTQSMTSTFDELQLLLNDYPFDVITLSETWLKDNISAPSTHIHTRIHTRIIRFQGCYAVGGSGVKLLLPIKYPHGISLQ